MDDFKYRNKRCDDCGFTKGTAANTNGVTEIKAQLCAEIPEPFYCHFNAQKVDGINHIEEDKMVLCQGWVETCNQLESEGFYQKQPDWQKELKSEIVEVISEVEVKLETKEMNISQAVELVDKTVREFIAK